MPSAAIFASAYRALAESEMTAARDADAKDLPGCAGVFEHAARAARRRAALCEQITLDKLPPRP